MIDNDRCGWHKPTGALSDVKSLTDTNFDVLMSNPITGGIPGDEYVKPAENADARTTVVLYQLRNGQRATDLRVGYADGHVAEIDTPGAGHCV